MAIQVDSRKVKNMITGYIRTIPKAANLGTFRLAQFGVRALKEEAKKAGIKHWGGGKRQLFSKQTRPVKVRKGFYNIVMPIHGVYLDSMRPHFVAFKKGRLITKWAKDRGKLFDDEGKRLPGVWVKPHPFIRPAVTRMIKKAKKTVEKKINKVIRRKGR